MEGEAYRDPIFNLKAVAERTGVTADALRAWERRYGLPSPARTEASHRVYAQRDIDIIQWLVARQEEGLRIGRAVKLWRSLEGEGKDPLRSMPLPTERPARRTPAGQTIASLRDEWLAASLAFDERGAEGVLSQAFAMYPPERVCSDIIGAAISEIGQGWYQGEVTPQQEHFASQLAARRLKGLLEATPPPTRRGRILAACPSGEEHTLGLLTLALLLRRAGWDVVYIGADVPLQEMEETIQAVEPDLVVMAAQQLDTAANLLDAAELVRHQAISLAFAGMIFDQEPGLRSRIPGHFLGSTITGAVQEVERLLTTLPHAVDIESPTEIYEEARRQFVDRRAAIENQVCRALSADSIDSAAIYDLDQAMAQTIVSALHFGDLDLIGRHLDWLWGLHESLRPPLQVLGRFLRAYRDAAEEQLEGSGAVVVEWLDQRVGQRAEWEEGGAA